MASVVTVVAASLEGREVETVDEPHICSGALKRHLDDLAAAQLPEVARKDLHPFTLHDGSRLVA